MERKAIAFEKGTCSKNQAEFVMRRFLLGPVLLMKTFSREQIVCTLAYPTNKSVTIIEDLRELEMS